MSSWQLAQINVARFARPVSDPVHQPFFDALDAINALAEAAPGFVWRPVGEASPATLDERLLVNLSVWASMEALSAFVYESDHRNVMVRRRAWFESVGGAHLALWWVPAGHRPSADEGLARLWHLDRFGATPHAFTFKQPHPPGDRPG